jgi:hypothetical protein
MLNEGCFCSTTRKGEGAGCSCVSIVDTEFGPRVREQAATADGSGRTIELAQAKADAETVAARVGPPAGARTGATRAVVDDGALVRAEVPPSIYVDENGAIRRR